MKFGVDISRWQKGFNLDTAIAEGVQYAIIKAGGSDDGRYKDGQFEKFYEECKKRGLPVGAYYFGKDMNTTDAKKSAEHFLGLLKGKQFELPVYYDVEGAMVQLGKNALTAVVETFCATVERAGYYTGIYSSLSFFNNSMNDEQLKKYTHWVASWGTAKPTLRSGADASLWQFGGETNKIRGNKVAGMTCDQDYLYVDFETAIKKAGLNGFPKIQEPEKQTIHCIVEAGDTLSAISEKYGVPVDEIVKNNNLIKPGDKLFIK